MYALMSNVWICLLSNVVTGPISVYYFIVCKLNLLSVMDSTHWIDSMVHWVFACCFHIELVLVMKICSDQMKSLKR